MSIFVCGFNGFLQVSNSTPVVEDGNSTVKDIVVTPLVVDQRHLACGNTAELKISDKDCKSESVDLQCMETKKRREEVSEVVSNGGKSTSVLELKDVVVSWDRIFYLWKNGQVTSTGGSLSFVDVKHDMIQNPFQDFRMQSLCTAQHKLFGIDMNGHLLVFSASDGTVPLQLKDSEDIQSNVDSSVVALFACENGSVVLHRDNRHIRFGELQAENCLLLCPLNFDLCVKSVSCGKHHILLLSVIGVVFSCGNGSQGQLGHGTIAGETEPRILEALEGITVFQVAAGGWHSMALSDIGDIYVWGWNEKGQLGLPCRNLRSPGKDISDENIGLETITVHETCSEHSSQTNGSTKTSTATPAMLSKPSDADLPSKRTLVNIQPFPVVLDFPVADPNDVFVTRIAVGSRHSVAVFEDGRTFSWGCNDYGQLGHGDTISRDCPKLITFFYEQGLSVDNVFSGFWNTVFLTR